MKKIPGNLLKYLGKSWKYHGILAVGTLGTALGIQWLHPGYTHPGSETNVTRRTSVDTYLRLV